jgi:hypothetical protein
MIKWLINNQSAIWPLPSSSSRSTPTPSRSNPPAFQTHPQTWNCHWTRTTSAAQTKRLRQKEAAGGRSAVGTYRNHSVDQPHIERFFRWVHAGEEPELPRLLLTHLQNAGYRGSDFRVFGSRNQVLQSRSQDNEVEVRFVGVRS